MATPNHLIGVRPLCPPDLCSGSQGIWKGWVNYYSKDFLWWGFGGRIGQWATEVSTSASVTPVLSANRPGYCNIQMPGRGSLTTQTWAAPQTRTSGWKSLVFLLLSAARAVMGNSLKKEEGQSFITVFPFPPHATAGFNRIFPFSAQKILSGKKCDWKPNVHCLLLGAGAPLLPLWRNSQLLRSRVMASSCGKGRCWETLGVALGNLQGCVADHTCVPHDLFHPLTHGDTPQDFLSTRTSSQCKHPPIGICSIHWVIHFLV